MSATFLSLSVEIHLIVNANLNDLDDAVSLARTCTHFYGCFQRYKWSIARSIILSSDVYEHDYRLSLFVNATSLLTRSYEQFGNNLPNDQRPRERTYFDCINMTRTDRPLANDFITEVCHRWQAHRVLRKLYLSEKVKAEYDLSRAKFTGSANHQHSHRFGAEFGGRFHKAICLHSVAIASRKLAIASQFSGPDQEEDVFQTVFDLWNKKSVVDEWGNDAEPSIQDKLDCLEVFDFLYLFVTTRLFVTEFPSWTGAIMNEWQFAGHALDTNPQAAQLLEICLLYGRWTLSPTDLAGLMSRGNDTPRLSWPVDKHRYLALRGAFDRGTPTDLDVVSQTERWSMVRAVVGSNERGDCFDTSTPCWWDRLRQLVGSPFQPNFLERTLWKLRRGDQRDKVYLYLLQTEIREELF